VSKSCARFTVYLRALRMRLPVGASSARLRFDFTRRTDSSSSSIVTWPPTDFSVTLVCTVTDPSGKVIAQPEVRGSGHAEFSKFKHNLGLSAQRATVDAVSKLPAAMQSVPALN
jgi:hypothetical protein